MKLYCLLFILCFSPWLILPAQIQTVERLFRDGNLKTASVSMYVMDAKTGGLILATPQKSLSPASVMKLYTTAVALEILGPDYTFTTSLCYSGLIDAKNGNLNGNLILVGGADPAFYSSFFEDHYKDCFKNWIDQIKRSGIKKITGKLLLDLGAMNGASIPGGWVWDDIGNYYGAGVSALSYSDNLYDIHFSSGKTEGEKCVIKSIQPEITGLSLENRVTSSKKTGDHTIIFGAPGSYHPYIEGTIPVNQSDFVVKGAMPDPALAAAGAFIKELKANGIQISGGVAVLTNETSPAKTIIGTMVSPPLKELIVPLNKESLNFYAEHLLREIGRKSSGTPSMEKGIEAYHFFCTLKGVDNEGFFPVDGSGLSRSNALTSKTLVETMKRVYDGKNRDIFFGALPVAGVDGTLRHSFKGTPLEKNMQAKTGSMARVRSIAGTMKTKNKREILFALIINNFDLSTTETTKLLESILMSLYNESE